MKYLVIAAALSLVSPGIGIRADQRAEHEPERAFAAGNVAKSTSRFRHDGTGSGQAMLNPGEWHERPERRQ